jgi:hypothetical protein
MIDYVVEGAGDYHSRDIKAGLLRRKKDGEASLAKINKALAALEANPGLAELMDLL